jgi:hypothetical protein
VLGLKKELIMIRFIIGLLLTFGAVGGLDNDPDAPLLVLTLIAVIGLGLMHSGVHALGRNNNE